MRIAYIATSHVPSTKANSIQVMKVCQALTQIGEIVHLYVPGNLPMNWEEIASHYGIKERFPVTRVASRKSFRRLDFTLASIHKARQLNADIIYTRMLWVARAAQWLGLPVILEMHDFPTGSFGPWLYRGFIRSRRKKLVVYITGALRSLLDEMHGKCDREDEIIIAPDGVDLERYESLPDPVTARRSLDLAEKPTALYSGGFYSGRGLDTLIVLAERMPDIQFLLVGGNEDQVSDTRQRIDQAGIKNLILTGFVANERLPLYHSSADVLLMPYSKSFSGSSGGNIAAVSSPMKMFEYMAARRAILASDIVVLREVLDDDNAEFYTPEDVADLEQKLRNLINDAPRRQMLAEGARMDVTRFDWKVRMKLIIDRMRTLLDSPR